MGMLTGERPVLPELAKEAMRAPLRPLLGGLAQFVDPIELLRDPAKVSEQVKEQWQQDIEQLSAAPWLVRLLPMAIDVGISMLVGKGGAPKPIMVAQRASYITYAATAEPGDLAAMAALYAGGRMAGEALAGLRVRKLLFRAGRDPRDMAFEDVDSVAEAAAAKWSQQHPEEALTPDQLRRVAEAAIYGRQPPPDMPSGVNLRWMEIGNDLVERYAHAQKASLELLYEMDKKMAWLTRLVSGWQDKTKDITLETPAGLTPNLASEVAESLGRTQQITSDTQALAIYNGEQSGLGGALERIAQRMRDIGHGYLGDLLRGEAGAVRLEPPAEPAVPEPPKEPWEMTTEAQQRIEQVIRNIRRRKYSRITQLDYANLGIELFDEPQFSQDLGVAVSDLATIFPLKRYPSQFGGKGIMQKPTPEELRGIVPGLANYLRKSKADFYLRQGKPVPPEVLADYPELAPRRAPEIAEPEPPEVPATLSTLLDKAETKRRPIWTSRGPQSPEVQGYKLLREMEARGEATKVAKGYTWQRDRGRLTLVNHGTEETPDVEVVFNRARAPLELRPEVVEPTPRPVQPDFLTPEERRPVFGAEGLPRPVAEGPPEALRPMEVPPEEAARREREAAEAAGQRRLEVVPPEEPPDAIKERIWAEARELELAEEEETGLRARYGELEEPPELPEAPAAAEPVEAGPSIPFRLTEQVPLEDIKIFPEKYQLRKTPESPELGFDESAVKRIMREFDPDQLTEVLLRRMPDGSLELMSGHHRMEVFRRLAKSGWKEWPAETFKRIPAKILENLTDEQALEKAIRANTDVRQFTPSEYGQILARKAAKGAEVQELAASYGKSPHWVQSRLYINNLPENVKDAVDREPPLFSVSAGAALGKAMEQYNIPPATIQWLWLHEISQADPKYSGEAIESLFARYAPRAKQIDQLTMDFGELPGMEGQRDSFLTALREMRAEEKKLRSARRTWNRVTRLIDDKRRAGDLVSKRLEQGYETAGEEVAKIDAAIEAMARGQLDQALAQARRPAVPEPPTVVPEVPVSEEVPRITREAVPEEAPEVVPEEAPEVAPPVEEAVPEVWQMTQDEFLAYIRGPRAVPPTEQLLGDDVAIDRANHERVVRRALAEGKPVPANVLAEYPELVPEAVPSVEEMPPEVPPEAPPSPVAQAIDQLQQAVQQLAGALTPATRAAELLRPAAPPLGAVGRAARAAGAPVVPPEEPPPEEPPPIAKPPTPDELWPRPLDNVAMTAMRHEPDGWRKMKAWAEEHFKPLSWAMEKMGVVGDDPVADAMVVHGFIKGLARTAELTVAELDAISDGDTYKFFGADKNGLITYQGKQYHVGDLLENKPETRSLPLTPEQTEFRQKGWDLVDDLSRLAAEEGVEIEPRGLQPGEHHWFRAIVSHTNPITGEVEYGVVRGRRGGRQIAAEMGIEKEREFATAQEASDAGYEVADPVEAMRFASRQVYTRIADERVRDIVLDFLPHRRAETGRLGEVLIRGIPGEWFPFKDVKRLLDLLGDLPETKLETAAKAADMLTNVSRMFQVGFDAGGVALQALISAARHPGVYFEAVVRGEVSSFSPKSMARFYALPWVQEILRTYGPYGLQGPGTAQETAGARTILGKRGLLGKIPLAGRAARAGARIFDNMLAAQRILLIRAEQHRAKTPADKAQLVRFVNTITGTVNTASQGLSRRHRVMEGATLYAGRLLRSTIAAIFDVAHGGLRGKLARESLGAYAIAMVLGYLAWCGLLKQKPKLNPLKDGSKFMTVKIGDQYIGPGGSYFMIARTLMQMAQDPKTAAETAKRFLRGKLAPGISTVMDIYNRRDFLGNPVPETLLGLSAYILKHNYVPIWLQGVFESGVKDIGMTAGISALELIGVRTFPQSAGRKRNELREELAEGTYYKPWADLNRFERLLLEKTPELKQLTQEARAIGVKRGNEWQLFWADVDSQREPYNIEIAQLGEALREGRITGNQYREEVGQRRMIMARIPEMLQRTQESRGIVLGGREANTPVDIFIEEYYQIADKIRDPLTGVADGREIVRQRELLKEAADPDVVIEAMAYINRNLDPEYVRARELYAEYQRIPQYLGLSEEETRLVSETEQQYRSLRRIQPWADASTTRWAMAQTNPRGVALMQQASKLRNPARRQFWAMHPEMALFYSDLTVEEVAGATGMGMYGSAFGIAPSPDLRWAQQAMIVGQPRTERWTQAAMAGMSFPLT